MIYYMLFLLVLFFGKSSGKFQFPKFSWKNPSIICSVSVCVAFNLIAIDSRPVFAATSVTLKSELQSYEVDVESKSLKENTKSSKSIIDKLKKELNINNIVKKSDIPEDSKELQRAKEKILTLKAYLDELERDLFKYSYSKYLMNMPICVYFHDY